MDVEILDVGLVVQEFAPEEEKLVKMGEAMVFLDFLLHLEDSGEERHLDFKSGSIRDLEKEVHRLALTAH